jgi:phosphoribosylformimino-5-aminoimidazole carboxamide ribotide isomerase
VFLIPSIDLRGGQCVRLLRGDFAAETRYDVDPVQYLQRFQHLGARWLHIVDLDGAREGTLGNLATLERLAAQPGIRLQVGGGVRSRESVQQLLSVGISRIVIGSAAVETPTTVMSWIKEFGAERCCLALDVRVDPQGVPRVQIRGWTQSTALSLWEALDAFVEVGVKDVLCTDIAQDGALEGPNLALYREALERFPQVAWQASGGVRDVRDLQALADTGVAAAISGKALLDGRINDTDLAVWLRTESESPISRPSGAEPRTA